MSQIQINKGKLNTSKATKNVAKKVNCHISRHATLSWHSKSISAIFFYLHGNRTQSYILENGNKF